jgi:hypothetical protein
VEPLHGPFTHKAGKICQPSQETKPLPEQMWLHQYARGWWGLWDFILMAVPRVRDKNWQNSHLTGTARNTTWNYYMQDPRGWL